MRTPTNLELVTKAHEALKAVANDRRASTSETYSNLAWLKDRIDQMIRRLDDRESKG